jgi:hypothetical protein
VGGRWAAGGVQIGQWGHVGAPEKTRAALKRKGHFTLSGKAVKAEPQVTTCGTDRSAQRGLAQQNNVAVAQADQAFFLKMPQLLVNPLA